MAKKARRKAGRPRKQALRKPCGRLVQEPVGPTPELRAQIMAHGPTCFIQRYAEKGVIGPDQARGVEVFARLRHLAGLAGKRYQTTLKEFIPQTGGDGVPDHVREDAMRALRECLQAMTGREADQVITVCEQSQPLDVEAFQAGAEVCRVVLIEGLTRDARAA